MKNLKKSREDIQSLVVRALHAIVPEVDLQTLDPDVSLRDELDIDSMDFYKFMLLLHRDINIDVPESDYGKLSTLNKCIEYLDLKINRCL